jgi:hypothetical protein
MSDPFLYLEDLEKAVPKPPASIGDQDKAPSGKATLSGIGKPQATPKASAGAKLSATNTMPKPPASIGDQGGKAPSAQTTLNQKSPVPSPTANAKAMASGGEWDYWEGSGAPTGAGWERGPKGGWRRPAGMGGGGSGETESLLEEMKTPQQEAKDVTAAQSSPKKTVSSGQDAGPVSSSAAKIEQAKRFEVSWPTDEDKATPEFKAQWAKQEAEDKRKAAKKDVSSKDSSKRSPEQQIDDMLREKKPGPGKPDTQFATTAVRTAAHKEVQAAAGEEEAKQALFGGGESDAPVEEKKGPGQRKADLARAKDRRETLANTKPEGKAKEAYEAMDAKDYEKAAQILKENISGTNDWHLLEAQQEFKKRMRTTPTGHLERTKEARDKREAAKKLKNAAEKQVKEELASQAKEGEKPKKPSNAEIEKRAQIMEMELDSHRQSAKNLLQNVQAHMELEQDPEERAKIEKFASVLEAQSNFEGELTSSDKDILKMAQQVAKHRGINKPPKDEQQQPQRKAPPKVNYGRVFDQARAAGEQIGGAAATLEGGGELATSAINYTSSGAVRGGHHLLSSKGEKKAADSAAKKAPKKGAEVEQSSMKTEKSLGIYLDLQKAVQTGTPHGHTTPSEDRARIKHESSYAKRPVGVANEGIVTEDDEDKGKDWKHADEDSVQTSVNQKLEAKEKDGEKEEEKEEVTKSLGPDPLAMLKSLNSEVQTELRRVLPTDLESTFMIEVLDYDPIVVSKGQASIRGKDRHRFNEWAHERLSKSISSLHERVGLNE